MTSDLQFFTLCTVCLLQSELDFTESTQHWEELSDLPLSLPIFPYDIETLTNALALLTSMSFIP